MTGGATSLSRLGAAAAAVVAVGHVPLLAGEAASAPLMTAVMALLALGCAHCAVSLWRSPGPAAWWTAGAMSVLMMSVHLGEPGGPSMPAGTADLAVDGLSMTAEVLLLALAVQAVLRTARPDSGESG